MLVYIQYFKEQLLLITLLIVCDLSTKNFTSEFIILSVSSKMLAFTKTKLISAQTGKKKKKKKKELILIHVAMYWFVWQCQCFFSQSQIYIVCFLTQEYFKYTVEFNNFVF